MSELLTNLAQEREVRVQDIHLDLPVPTWNGTLIARYNVLDRSVVEKFSGKKRTLTMDQDFVLQSVRELYAYDPDQTVTDAMRKDDDPDFVRVESEDGGPITFTSALAAKIGADGVEKGRDVLMFCVKDNAIAVGGLAGTLVRWMQNTDRDVAAELSGE